MMLAKAFQPPSLENGERDSVIDTRMMTAYHEAGHATIAIILGRPIHKISIIPNKTRLGACEIKKGRFQPSNDWLEDEILILLAGVAAEAKLTGRYDWHGAGQDLRNVRRLTLSRAGDETRAEKLERRLLAKAEHLLADDATWKTAEQIAQALLEKETISGRAAMHFHNQNQT
jgi:ATP-dependent Zn protease